MYNGQGGAVTGGAGATAVATGAAGIAVLPNTGENIALTILSIATLVLGLVVLTSFIVSRIVIHRNK